MIAILLAYENTCLMKGIRPFVNWAHGLNDKNDNDNIEFLLVNVGRKITEYLLKSFFQLYNFNNIKDLLDKLIFTDDYIERVKILDEIDGNFRKTVYCQVLYGIHAVSAVPSDRA